MSYFSHRLAAPIAAMVAVLALGMATPARANLQIWVSTTGPATAADIKASTGSGGSISYTSTLGAFKITVLSASSNSPGDPVGGTDLFGSQTTLTNTTGATQTIWITIGDTGFLTPYAPPGLINVTSSIGGSVKTGSAANVFNFQSYVDAANGQNATTGASFTTGAQISGVTPYVVTTAGSYNNTVTGTISSLNPTQLVPYSISESFKITLGAHAALGFQSTTDLLNPTLASVPEPSSLAIAGFGGLALIGYGLRRRKALGV